MNRNSLEAVFQLIGFGRFQYLIVFICGLVQSFDSIEILILAYLQPILKCVWQTNVWEESFLTTGVFLGMMIGGAVVGRFSDMYGRKTILITISCLLGYMSQLCAASPSIVWMTILRVVVGFSIGGIVPSIFTLASELMPTKNRGISLILIMAFGSFGSYIITILCITIVPWFGWRVFILISGLPILFCLPCLFWLPESPRFLLLKHRKAEALDVINRIAKFNRHVPITDVIEMECQTYSFMDVFHENYLNTTILMASLCMISGLSFYGIVLIVTVLDNTQRPCLQNMKLLHRSLYNITALIDDSCCIQITWSNSFNTIIATTGEFLFFPLSIAMVKMLGRKYSMAMFSIFIAFLFVIINICMHPWLMAVVLFVIRGAISSNFNLNYIYATEVFPTSVRSFALGICCLAARFGALLSPFLVNLVVIRLSFVSGMMIFAFLNFVAFIISVLLPYETKDRPLFQTAEELLLLPDKNLEK